MTDRARQVYKATFLFPRLVRIVFIVLIVLIVADWLGRAGRAQQRDHLGVAVAAVDGPLDRRVAAERNHIEIVKLLLAAPGAGYALKTKNNGNTPLETAINRGHAELIALLRAASAPE